MEKLFIQGKCLRTGQILAEGRDRLENW